LNKNKRIKSREKLLNHLNESCQSVYNPPNLKNLSKEIAADYLQYIEKKNELEEELRKSKASKSSSADNQFIKTQGSKNVSKESNKVESTIEKEKEPPEIEQEPTTVENNNLAIGKIKELEDKKTRLKKEIEEKERIIRQKVLKHILNNYDGINNELGGNFFLDNITEDNNN